MNKLKEIQQEQIKERDEIVEEMIQEEIKAETAEELKFKTSRNVRDD